MYALAVAPRIGPLHGEGLGETDSETMATEEEP